MIGVAEQSPTVHRVTLNPWRLRLLEALDRVGTVRAVAEEQRLAPSTVSEQLALLEAEVRTTLLERSGRRLRLTPAGRLLAARSRELLDHMDAIEAELAELSAEPVGHIRVASFASALTSLVLPAAVALSRSHPRLALELLELEPHESVDLVAAAVECGLCVAILPKLAFSEHRHAVASARVEGLGQRRIWLAMRAGVRRRVAVQTLVAALRAQAAALGHDAG